ncbi:MAG: hypothetical protein QCI38_03130 [Candidatus Thermoplasmatota archaeon]|nr:hypothetical protein [Candidatus Thermoplasmatota archaeon]
MAVHEDMVRYVKYPFLRGASEYVKGLNIGMASLLSDRAYEGARIAGGERATRAVREGELPPPVRGSEAEMLSELLSYPVARMVVSCTGDKYVVKRYALAEATRARNLLVEDEDECILEMAEELDITASFDDGAYLVHFADYLRYTVQMRSKEAKLINQRVDKGMVILGKEKFARVLQQAIQLRIEGELPLPVNAEIERQFSTLAHALKEIASSKRKKFDASSVGRVSTSFLPPCMKILLGRMQAGENLPHSGRFALTAFLHSLGLGVEDIIKSFAISPDFNEAIARYQVEHITGESSGTEYSAPGCEAMKTYGLCPGEDELCSREWMTHPLIYYRAKEKRTRENWRRKQASEKDTKRKGAEKKNVAKVEEKAGGDEEKKDLKIAGDKDRKDGLEKDVEEAGKKKRGEELEKDVEEAGKKKSEYGLRNSDGGRE